MSHHNEFSLILAKNCVYDWVNDKKHERDPRWRNLPCLDASIRDDAPKPKRWLRFLDKLWRDDEASKDLLHEFMGLTLTVDTSFQKMLLLFGPPKAGKGTIIRILTEIHGRDNVAVTPSIASLGKSFGLQPLLNKSVATIINARFSEKDIDNGINRLLNITGEDYVMVNLRHRAAIPAIQLFARFVVSTNELPVRHDCADDALYSRFLILQFTSSFEGREDSGLQDALSKEKDGILQLMVDGLRRLYRQGFTRTSYQEALTNDLEKIGSPFRAFVQKRCEFGKDKWVPVQKLYEEWRKWRGYDMTQPRNGGDAWQFRRDIMMAFPTVHRGEKHGVPGQCYFGIALRDDDAATDAESS